MGSIIFEILYLEKVYYNPNMPFCVRKKVEEFLIQLLSGERTFMPYESIDMLIEDYL